MKQKARLKTVQAFILEGRKLQIGSLYHPLTVWGRRQGRELENLLIFFNFIYSGGVGGLIGHR